MWTEYSRFLQEKREQLKNIGIKNCSCGKRTIGFCYLNHVSTFWTAFNWISWFRLFGSELKYSVHPAPFLLGEVEGFSGKEEVTFFMRDCNFHIKNKLKSEIFNDKKSWSAKIFFSVCLGWYPNAHYEIYQYIIIYIILFFVYIKVILWIEYRESSIFHIL